MNPTRSTTLPGILEEWYRYRPAGDSHLNFQDFWARPFDPTRYPWI